MTVDEVIKVWTTALRSGKYEQGRWKLRDEDNKFCCLGVLADVLTDGKCWETLTVDDGLPPRDLYLPASIQTKALLTSDSGGFSVFDSSEKLKKVLKKLFDCDDVACTVEDFAGRFGTSLSELNDTGASFAIIADIIEAKPEGLFVE